MEAKDIISIASPIIETKNLFLVEVKISKDNVIQIFVDSLQGVNIQSCIEISREIEECLDREKEDFELTVSSAGIGYPFKVDGQYRKNINKKVEVKLNDSSKLEGILTGFDEENIYIEYEEKKVVDGQKKKQLVKTEKIIQRKEIKQIKDIISF